MQAGLRNGVKRGVRRRVRGVGHGLSWGCLLGREFCGSWYRICRQCGGGRLVQEIQVVRAGLGEF